MSPLQNLSLSPLETLTPSSIQMHLALENIQNFSSPTKGAYVVSSCLTTVRVAAVPFKERNFRIFYYLMVGAWQEERQHLHLTKKTQYCYLG